jgi:hypothetical protein
MPETDNDNVKIKPCSDWTPRDHYIKATQCLEAAETIFDNADVRDLIDLESVDDEHIAQLMRFADMHARLAAIPHENVVPREIDEDYRP